MTRRIALFAAGWLLAMTAFAVSGLWRPLDHWLFQQLFLRQAPAALQGLVLVDVPYDRSVTEEQRYTVYRQRVAAMLGDLAAAIAKGAPQPEAVILDIAFTKPTDAGVEAIVQSIARLRAAAPRVTLFGSVIPWKESGNDPDPDYAARHIQDIYDRLDGSGHTAFAQHGRLLLYPGTLLLAGKSTAELHLPALPIVIARRLFRLSAESDPEAVIVPLGDGSFPVLTPAFEGETATLARPIDWKLAREAVLVVGDLRRDVENPYRRPGPELFAWALSDLALHSRDRSTREPLNHAGFTMAQILALALLAVGAFHVALRWRLARVDPASANAGLWMLGLGAWGVALLVLACVAVAFLLVDRVIPVTLAAAGAGLAVLACVLLADRWLAQVIGDAHRFMRVFPQRFRYDVFVSYSREPQNAAWVEREVVTPLRAARNAKGEPLQVFFDKSEIGVGERWEEKILSSLASSRVFLPVYSPDYFDKPYCKLEVELAVVLEKAQRGPLVNLPILRGAKVPDSYQAVQYVDAASVSFMEPVIAAVLAAAAR